MWSVLGLSLALYFFFLSFFSLSSFVHLLLVVFDFRWAKAPKYSNNQFRFSVSSCLFILSAVALSLNCSVVVFCACHDRWVRYTLFWCDEMEVAFMTLPASDWYFIYGFLYAVSSVYLRIWFFLLLLLWSFDSPENEIFEQWAQQRNKKNDEGEHIVYVRTFYWLESR